MNIPLCDDINNLILSFLIEPNKNDLMLTNDIFLLRFSYFMGRYTYIINDIMI